MKKFFSVLVVVLIPMFSVYAQDEQITQELASVVSLAIDTTECCVDCDLQKQFHSIEKALANKENVYCLVLSFGSPKYTAIPKEVSQFPHLTCLDISFNRVAVIPEEILQCKQLYCLDLSGNHYLQDLPRFLKQLPNLKVIRLYDMTLWSEAKKQQLRNEFAGIYLEFE
jgi:hypothetical protein